MKQMKDLKDANKALQDKVKDVSIVIYALIVTPRGSYMSAHLLSFNLQLAYHHQSAICKQLGSG